MRIIAIANQKGGVAKTTTVVNLGHALAESGLETLLVDMDPQGHLAEGFGIAADELEADMSAVLDGQADIRDVIQQVRPKLSIAPSNIRLSAVEAKLFLKARREDKLKQALQKIDFDYDIALIDCPPSLGLLTVNSLTAASEILIPMTTDYYSMLGVELLLQTIEEMKAELNPNLRVLGILPTRVTRTIHAREVLERTRRDLDGHIRVFDILVSDSVRFREATALGKTILEHAPNIPGALAYRELSKELLV